MVGGKICQLVIDSSSCKNVVVEEVVNKMKFEIVQHPNPYKLSWLKKGNEVQVSKHRLVTFSIGSKYKD